ncbi:hypothetical protein Ddye_028936 [Dipteronia dyeriana]|uniref:Uncharacterized protein n=1 Tax=Dipteronia dyeriana TaxID=168575 RepID=A0AAD9TEM7_9ROSI|nr:hypothetical protein Ddye_028936 [Dipteronia dyeriana]
MSTNLQIRTNNLPEIRLPEIRIRTSVLNSNKIKAAAGCGELLSEGCRTPTSVENKIPEISTCPPAPRKPKRKVADLSCKKKLFAQEFQFFETNNREEIETFFRSSFDQISSSSTSSSTSSSSSPVVAKRRCKCT